MQRESIFPFMKMHGLGNDFMVVDARNAPVKPEAQAIARLADRRTGIGFDQLAIIRIAEQSGHDAKLEFYNADGSPSATCGNATRCIARWLLDQSPSKTLHFETGNRLVEAREHGDGRTAVNLGHPEFEWHQIPLSREIDSLTLPLDGAPTALSMGNPHCAYFVEDVNSVALDRFGPEIEYDPLFPERTNVEIIQKLSEERIKLRIWERGTGITRASGSCSAAAAVACARREITTRHLQIELEGGELEIDWRDDGVWMIGETAYVFDGTLRPEYSLEAGHER